MSSTRHDRRSFTPENVRMVRKALRLTQEEFGRQLGISRRTVIRWEQGVHLPGNWHSNKNGRHTRRAFYLLWAKYEEWVQHVAARESHRP